MKRYKNREQGTGKKEQVTGNREQREKRRSLLCYLLLVICYLLLASCATSPKAAPAREDGSPDFSVLPQGARIYLWADVEKAKPLLSAISFAGLEGKDAGQVMDRTDTAMAAFFPKGAERSFFLAGWGKYPNFRSGIAMGFSRGWEKKKSRTGNRYWHSKSNNLGVVIGPQFAFASDADPFTTGPGKGDPPQGFEAFRKPCVLALWFENPGVQLGNIMEGLGIPIQIPAEDFFVGTVKAADKSADKSAENSWELFFRIRTQSAVQARSLHFLFSMAGLFLQRAPQNEAAPDAAPDNSREAAALLFANPPEQDGDSLVIRTGPLSDDRIALLFSLFSLYSE